MNISEGEDLFLRSLDNELSEKELQRLQQAMDQNSELKYRSVQHTYLRQLLIRKEPESFGFFFAERIANRINQLKKEIDYQIFFFFKKYQLLAAGIVIALLALNILFSEQLSVKSVFGFEDETIEDVLSIDVYANLTK